jgi:hypothetical protein
MLVIVGALVLVIGVGVKVIVKGNKTSNIG